MDLERLGRVELVEVGAVPVRRDEQVPGRVRELVQQDEGVLAAVDDELLLVVALGRAAEDAAVLLVGVPGRTRAATAPTGGPS